MRTRLWLAIGIFGITAVTAGGQTAKKRNTAESSAKNSANLKPVLWKEPSDIGSRNLYFGPGGEKHQPQAPFTFVKEDGQGSNPKFEILDRDGVKWKVKLGAEARPETVASRLVWAAGYFADEEYFLETLKTQDGPIRLTRGQNRVQKDGSVRDARLKRERPGKNAGDWKWRANPFVKTREENGLRVLMALINNWDLKDENNAVLASKDGEAIYLVSDLGATFGATGLSIPLSSARGNLGNYTQSKFISKIHTTTVDFGTPASAPFILFLTPDFYRRLGLRGLGHGIPREDAKWLGGILARLSPSQLDDAFRAAGYKPEEILRFRDTVQKRIADLQKL